jgi:hypothetical protein
MLLQLKAKKCRSSTFFLFLRLLLSKLSQFFSIRDNPHVFTSGLLFCPFSTFPSDTRPWILMQKEVCGNLEHPKFGVNNSFCKEYSGIFV